MNLCVNFMKLLTVESDNLSFTLLVNFGMWLSVNVYNVHVQINKNNI